MMSRYFFGMMIGKKHKRSINCNLLHIQTCFLLASSIVCNNSIYFSPHLFTELREYIKCKSFKAKKNGIHSSKFSYANKLLSKKQHKSINYV